MRSIHVPPWCLAKRWLKRAVRAALSWRRPVGLGAKRTRTSLMPLSLRQEAYCLGGYALAPAREAEAFGGGAAHGDARGFDAEGDRQVLAYGVPVVPDLGPLADHDRVHVDNLPGVPDKHLAHLAQELDGVGGPVALVGVGEVVADVL